MNWSIIATFFNIGKISKAPGTVATLATVPLVYALSLTNGIVYMVFCLLLFPVGILAAEFHERKLGTHDSSEIVIDEVLGFLIAMTWVPITWQSMLVGFFLFRVLDILKPFPIGYIDKKVHGGLGVIADDVVAGIAVNVLMQVMLTKTNWLGTQVLVFGS